MADQKILNEIARSHAFYHAKGLEVFALPCTTIGALNPADINEVRGAYCPCLYMEDFSDDACLGCAEILMRFVFIRIRNLLACELTLMICILLRDRCRDCEYSSPQFDHHAELPGFAHLLDCGQLFDR